jgi:hypothetical protein
LPFFSFLRGRIDRQSATAATITAASQEENSSTAVCISRAVLHSPPINPGRRGEAVGPDTKVTRAPKAASASASA